MEALRALTTIRTFELTTGGVTVNVQEFWGGYFSHDLNDSTKNVVNLASTTPFIKCFEMTIAKIICIFHVM